MSKIIEEVALEYCRENDLECFGSGDLSILHTIYDRAIRKGTKPLPKHKYHPMKVLQKIRNGMRTGYYFDRTVVKDSILKKMSIWTIKKRARNRKEA